MFPDFDCESTLVNGQVFFFSPFPREVELRSDLEGPRNATIPAPMGSPCIDVVIGL